MCITHTSTVLMAKAQEICRKRRWDPGASPDFGGQRSHDRGYSTLV